MLGALACIQGEVLPGNAATAVVISATTKQREHQKNYRPAHSWAPWDVGKGKAISQENAAMRGAALLPSSVAAS